MSSLHKEQRPEGIVEVLQVSLLMKSVRMKEIHMADVEKDHAGC